jgi:hypothetical protein
VSRVLEDLIETTNVALASRIHECRARTEEIVGYFRRALFDREIRRALLCQREPLDVFASERVAIDAARAAGAGIARTGATAVVRPAARRGTRFGAVPRHTATRRRTAFACGTARVRTAVRRDATRAGLAGFGAASASATILRATRARFAGFGAASAAPRRRAHTARARLAGVGAVSATAATATARATLITGGAAALAGLAAFAGIRGFVADEESPVTTALSQCERQEAESD